MQQTIASFVEDAIAARVFPGAVVLAARAGRILHHAAYGSTMYDDPGSQPVTPDTLYDIASLTKIFTATAALQLYDARQLALDDPVVRYLPALRASDVTIRHLLTHTSGLSLRLSALRQLAPAALRAAVYAAEAQHPPGSFVAYVNLSTMLLGDVVAQIYGGPLDAALGELLLEPLGLSETTYNPPAALRERIAPTEWDNTWRAGLVHGSVHDESAAALGGVAGHAGLFSSARDLERFCRMWLQRGAWEGRQLLREATVALATRDYTGALPSPQGIGLCGGLGWMLDRPAFMGRAPAGTLGHTGFTGPLLVLVPTEQLALVLLTNRTYPQRQPPPLRHHAVAARLVNEMCQP